MINDGLVLRPLPVLQRRLAPENTTFSEVAGFKAGVFGHLWLAGCIGLLLGTPRGPQINATDI